MKAWRGLLIALTAWLVLGMACNFPGLPPRSPQLSSQQLRQTLQAQATVTAEGKISTIEPGGAKPTIAFTGLHTATPLVDAGPPPPRVDNPAVFHYQARSGDTLSALAGRFGVAPEQIISAPPVHAEYLIPVGQELDIPNTLGKINYPSAVLPDSEVINSPSAAGFDLVAYIRDAGGYLSTYHERVGGQDLTGVKIVNLVATESSVHPRLLLALLEMRAGWVLGTPPDAKTTRYPLGFSISNWEGLYKEMVIAATHLNAGYYGWRNGSFTDMKFQDGRVVRLSPELNAGSVAVQTLLAMLYPQLEWEMAVYGDEGLLGRYQQMFGDPWKNAASVEPLFPDGIAQPELALPFAAGERWSLTGGPHLSWKTGSPRGAVDFAPVTGEARCAVSQTWVTASASGRVVRSERNVVAVDLDGDGYEQTGWVIVYLHLADLERVQTGVWVDVNDRLGHPSCEGGTTTGTHVHFARKYNGEWLAADGPLPMVLSGWQVYADERNYQGGMRKGNQEVVASPVGPRTSIIVR